MLELVFKMAVYEIYSTHLMPREYHRAFLNIECTHIRQLSPVASQFGRPKTESYPTID